MLKPAGTDAAKMRDNAAQILIMWKLVDVLQDTT